MVGETKQRIPHTNLYQEWPKSGLRKSDNVGTLYMVPSAVYALDGVEHFPTAFTEVRAPGRHVPAPCGAHLLCASNLRIAALPRRARREAPTQRFGGYKSIH